MGKHHAVIASRLEGEVVAVIAEIEFGMQFFRGFAAKVQEGVGATCLTDGDLQLFVQDAANQAKEANQVGFANAISTYQDIEHFQFKFAFGNGFVAA